MGIYSDSLREREERDKLSAKRAKDDILKAIESNIAVNPSKSEKKKNGDSIVPQNAVPLKADAESENIQFLSDCDSDILFAIGKILSAWNVPIEFSEESDGDGLEEILQKNLERNGILYDYCELSDDWYDTSRDHMIGFTEKGEAVALFPSLIGYKAFFLGGKKIRAVSKKSMSLSDFAVVIHRPYPYERFSVSGFLRYLLSLLCAKDILPVLFAAAFISVMGTVTPAVYHIVLNRIVPLGNDGYKYLLVYAVVFIITGIIQILFGNIKNILTNTLTLRLNGETASLILGKVLNMSENYFRKNTAGRISAKMNNGAKLTKLLCAMMFDTAFTAVFSIVYIPQMFIYGKSMAPAGIAIIAFNTLTGIFVGLAEMKRERRNIELGIEINGLLFSGARAVNKIKNSGAAKRIFAKWGDIYKEKINLTNNPPLIITVGAGIKKFISSTGIILLLIITFKRGLNSGDYISFISAFTLASAGMSNLSDLFKNFLLIRPYAEQIAPFFAVQGKRFNKKYSIKPKGRIRVENIVFGYSPNDPPVLKGVSFEIEEGECVAIVGESGCGKSTLLRILLGFDEPDSGYVYYDDERFEAQDIAALRKEIGVVLQNGKLIPGTIYENIAFNSPGITEEEVWTAAEKAQIADYIRSLELGMETEITEGSGRISGGQKQCLMIARALARKPSILFLDEATSALDNITQNRVLETLTLEKCTRVMVAHRLSTVVDCDKIIAIKNGCVEEIGNYEELIKKDGYFADLVRRQLV